MILDGWGLDEATDHNAITLARPAYWEKLWREYPHSVLKAREEHVGLPCGCLSGSEVGHMILGAGRVVYQSAARIEKTLREGTWNENQILVGAEKHLREFGGKIHLVGLLSDGGIHAHITHLKEFIKWARGADDGAAVGEGVVKIKSDAPEGKIRKICLHLFLDGRDMPPKSALDMLKREILPELDATVEITTMCGRATAMDRNENWGRTGETFELLTEIKEISAEKPDDFLAAQYTAGVTDEFIQPTRFSQEVVGADDAVIFFNFRADRMRQLARYFIGQAPESEQARVKLPLNLYLASLTEYDAEFRQIWVMYPPEYPKNTLGEWVSAHNLKQFRVTETEKYAHLTYFFNGGQEQTFEGESRLVIPSLGLTNYASQPEMSLPEVVKTLNRVLDEREYDLVITNFANGDMVAHSGDFPACLKAVAEVDKALAQVIPVALKNDYTVVITADHGNIEHMREKDEPHTAHSFNDVPLIITDKNLTLPAEGYLYQVAGTVLKLMDLPLPPEMGENALI